MKTEKQNLRVLDKKLVKVRPVGIRARIGYHTLKIRNLQKELRKIRELRKEGI